MDAVFVSIRPAAIYVYRSGDGRENGKSKAACVPYFFVNGSGNSRLFVPKRIVHVAVGGFIRDRSRLCFFASDDVFYASYASCHAGGRFIGDGTIVRLFAGRVWAAGVWVALRHHERMDRSAGLAALRFWLFAFLRPRCGAKQIYLIKTKAERTLLFPLFGR